MKHICRFIGAVLLLAVTGSFSSASAQGTAFTYQGRLNNATGPATGSYDFAFGLFNTNSGGVQLGMPVTNSAVAVTNGLFTTLVDFGPGIFTGGSNWLEIAVRTNATGTFLTLAPRQQLTPTPYALYAATASNLSGTISAGQLTGALTPAQLPATVLTNGAGGVNLTGTLSGNGAGLTNLNLGTNSLGAISYTAPVWGNFTTASTIGLNNQADTAAFLDLNGDGRPDFITLGSYSLLVYTNYGVNYALSFTYNFPIGQMPGHPVVLDANNDGRPDVAVLTGNPSTLTVLTNDGAGHLVQSFVLPLSSTGGYDWLTLADVNGDGRLDLVATLGTSNTVVIFTNNGNGGFAASSATAVGAAPLMVCAADVNGNGLVDLITANLSGSLTVLTNNGAGIFTSNATLSIVGTAYFVCAADFSGKGRQDLASCGPAGLVTVFTNNGAGIFTSNAVLNLGPVAGPISVIATNVTGRGYPDLISANYNTNTLTIFTNNGAGRFALSTTVNVNPMTQFVYPVDLNGDGMLDLVCLNSAQLTICTNWPTPPIATFQGSFSGNGAALTSLNANAIVGGLTTNLIVTTPGGSRTLFFTNGILRVVQ